MALTPPYEELVTRFVLMHDPNSDVTSTHPPAIFRDQVAHLALPRGMPHSCGFRCPCPPAPGMTRSPTGSVLPDIPSWQPFVLLGAVRRRGIAAWNPWSSCASARPTVSLFPRDWFRLHRHAVILTATRLHRLCRKWRRICEYADLSTRPVTIVTVSTNLQSSAPGASDSTGGAGYPVHST